MLRTLFMVIALGSVRVYWGFLKQTATTPAPIDFAQ